MAKIISTVLIVFSIAAHAECNKNCQIYKQWKRIDHDFVIGNIQDLHKREHSNYIQIELYANAMIDASHLDVNGVIRKARKCLSIKPHYNAQYFMHFVCLLSISMIHGYDGHIRNYFYFQAKAHRYAIKYFDRISSVYGKYGLSDYIKIAYVDMKIINKWPKTKYNIRGDWSHMHLRNGILEINLNGTKIPVIVDTGSTGIHITKYDARKFDLFDKLYDANVKMLGKNYYGSSPNELYIAKKLKIGPLTIHNAYLTVGGPSIYSPYIHSSIGVDVLRNFKRIFFYENGIFKIKINYSQKCNKMHILNYGVANAYWAIGVDIDTSFGKYTYLLDSGYDSDYPDEAISLNSDLFSNLVRIGRLKPLNNMNVIVSDVDGNSHKGKRRSFRFKFTQHGFDKGYVGMVLSNQFTSPESPVTGVVGFDTMRNAKAGFVLDFIRQKACMIPSAKFLSSSR